MSKCSTRAGEGGGEGARLSGGKKPEECSCGDRSARKPTMDIIFAIHGQDKGDVKGQLLNRDSVDVNVLWEEKEKKRRGIRKTCPTKKGAKRTKRLNDLYIQIFWSSQSQSARG